MSDEKDRAWLVKFLLDLAVAVESDAVETSDVLQALFRRGDYTVDCAIWEAENGGKREQVKTLTDQMTDGSAGWVKTTAWKDED